MRDFHNGPQAMARSLATYLDCPQRIKREVEATFGTRMNVRQIAEYRACYLRKEAAAERAAREQIDLAQADHDNRYARNMRASSNVLATAIFNLGGHR